MHEPLGYLAKSVVALAMAMLFAGAALAAAVVQSMKGDVRAGPIGKPAATVAVDQRLTSGTAVVTGPDAQVILRFDDGQQVVLNHNTHFRIADFRYLEGDPRLDRSVFALLKGALRIVSGAIATRNRSTIGVRGTDFMVALVNPAYVSVLQGNGHGNQRRRHRCLRRRRDRLNRDFRHPRGGDPGFGAASGRSGGIQQSQRGGSGRRRRRCGDGPRQSPDSIRVISEEARMIVTAPARSAPQNAARPVLEYQSGFGNFQSTEAVPGAVVGRPPSVSSK